MFITQGPGCSSVGGFFPQQQTGTPCCNEPSGIIVTQQDVNNWNKAAEFINNRRKGFFTVADAVTGVQVDFDLSQGGTLSTPLYGILFTDINGLGVDTTFIFGDNTLGNPGSRTINGFFFKGIFGTNGIFYYEAQG